MSIFKRLTLLVILVLAYTVISGCAPCKDYKAIIVDLDNQIVDLQETIKTREATIAEGEQLANDLREQIKEVEAEKQVLVDQINEVVVVTIPNEISFKSGQVMVLDTMIPTLEAIRDATMEYPDWEIFVEGYTDSQKLWPDWQEVWPTNWELGAARAAAVTRYLTNWLDMDATRFAVVSYGPFRPVADNSTPEGREQNRFVRIVMHRTN
jgi:chemotaxis protein MotB